MLLFKVILVMMYREDGSAGMIRGNYKVSGKQTFDNLRLDGWGHKPSGEKVVLNKIILKTILPHTPTLGLF